MDEDPAGEGSRNPEVDRPGTEATDPLAEALRAEDARVRELVEAGAASPEELRALAERIRERRQREEDLWRREVKPALVKARKGKLDLRYLRSSSAPRSGEQRAFLAGAAGAVLVIVLVLSVLDLPMVVLLVPLAAFLVYAWRLGQQSETTPEPPPQDPTELP